MPRRFDAKKEKLPKRIKQNTHTLIKKTQTLRCVVTDSVVHVWCKFTIKNSKEQLILSTALAKNHAKHEKGDTSHVTKMNIFSFFFPH